MAPIHLEGLPLDIKVLILGYIIRPTDMKNLCLVSKHLCAFITPQLYRKIELEFGGPPDHRISALLGRENPGIYHIRVLVLHQHEECDEKQAHFMLRLLIELLPRDILHNFSWLLAETMRVDDILLLYQRQSGLRNLCVTKTDQPFFPSLKTRPGVLSSLKSVESAEIYASDEDALRAGQIILETYHDLKNLSVHIDSECTDSSFSFTKQNPQAAKKRTEPIMSLFSHMLPFGSCSAMNLRSLKLIDLNLQQAAATLLKVINFSRLEDLTFHSCTGMQQFLQAMTKAFAATTTESNRLSSLSMELYEEEERPLMDDLDRFLLVLAKRVTWLSLCIMDARRCPNVEGIVRQASSLSTLLVVILDEVGQQIAYSAQEFSRISSNCVKLEQLSLSFPPDSDQSLWNFMASAWQLPSLHTLNIASWPSLSVGLGLEDYKAQLQLFAQRIFESNDRYTSKLAALGIGTDCYAGLNEGDTVQGHIERADYVRGKRAGIFGQNIVLAIPITVCLLQYTHPDSNLLHDDPLDLWTGLHPAIN